MKPTPNKCKECKHSIFNEIWGEYKCKIHHSFVDRELSRDCPYYEKEKEKNE